MPLTKQDELGANERSGAQAVELEDEVAEAMFRSINSIDLAILQARERKATIWIQCALRKKKASKMLDQCALYKKKASKMLVRRRMGF